MQQLVDMNKLRMCQRLQRLQLSNHLFKFHLLAPDLLFQDNFDSTVYPIVPVDRLPDLAVGPLADDLAKYVALPNIFNAPQ